MLKKRRGKRTKKPSWKKRIRRTLKLEEKILDFKQRESERLNRIYRLEERGTVYVSAVY